MNAYGHQLTLVAVAIKTPQAGFEPATNRLTADRSTTELLRNANLIVSRIWAFWQALEKKY